MKSDNMVLVKRVQQVNTKNGAVNIRELEIDDVAAVTEVLFDLFDGLSESQLRTNNNIAVVKMLVASKRLTGIMKKLCAIVSDKPTEFFDHLSLVDFLCIVRAFLQVNPLSELRELFFGLRKLLILGNETGPNTTK